MKLFGYYLLTKVSTAIILILLYSGVLWHTFRGSKFTFIYMIVTLLILANVSLIVNADESKRVYIDHSRHDNDTFMDAVVYALAIGLYDLTQCVSHLLIAFRYREVAKKMPYAIEEVQVPEAEKRGDKVLFKVMLILNIIFPTIETVLLISQVYFQTEEKVIALDFLLFCVSMMQIVSGYFMIKGLKEIRDFIS